MGVWPNALCICGAALVMGSVVGIAIEEKYISDGSDDESDSENGAHARGDQGGNSIDFKNLTKIHTKILTKYILTFLSKSSSKKTKILKKSVPCICFLFKLDFREDFCDGFHDNFNCIELPSR